MKVQISVQDILLKAKNVTHTVALKEALVRFSLWGPQTSVLNSVQQLSRLSLSQSGPKRWSDRLNTRIQFSNQALIDCQRRFIDALRFLRCSECFPKTIKDYVLPAGLGNLARRNILHLRAKKIMSVMSSESASSRSDYNLDFLLSLPGLSDSCHSAHFSKFLLFLPVFSSILLTFLWIQRRC